jgi:hypothetical protein
VLARPAAELLVGVIDGTKKLVEVRRILNRPDPVECRTEDLQVTLGE